MGEAKGKADREKIQKHQFRFGSTDVQLGLEDGEAVKFDELTALAREHGLFNRLIGGEGGLKPADKSAFGKLLKKYDRTLFAGCQRFVVDGKGHSRRFRAVTEG
jgi:hypothetical protein